MEQVNPGIKRKNRFVIIDAVGVCEKRPDRLPPLEKKRTVTFDKLLDAIALGNREPEVLESLAGRLVRLEKRFDEALALRCAVPRRARRSVRSRKLCSPQPIPTISKPRPRKVKTNTFNRQRKIYRLRKPR